MTETVIHLDNEHGQPAAIILSRRDAARAKRQRISAEVAAAQATLPDDGRGGTRLIAWYLIAFNLCLAALFAWSLFG